MLIAKQALDDARRISGLDDYGDLRFAEGLNVLITSINEDAGLEPDDEARVRGEVLRVLINRLRMRRDIVAHPDILDEEVLPPVFITSMPRTGSTKLHRILAATGDFNALPFWMSYNFAPLGSEGASAEPRIKAADDYLQWMYKKAPLFQLAHPQYAEEIEEELSLLDAGFNSLYRWAAQLHVPRYIEWVLGQTGLAFLEDLRALLQYIQWQHYRGQGRRWILKTPSLFGFEAAYSAVFKDTDFIVTHRDPEQTWPSVCTLFCGVRALYSDADFSGMAGDVMLHNFAESLKPHLAWRDAYPIDKVLDLRFTDIMADEVALTRKVHDWLGMTFSSDSEAGLRDWLKMDAARGHQRNAATLADYAIEPAQLHQRLAGYYQRYGAFL